MMQRPDGANCRRDAPGENHNELYHVPPKARCWSKWANNAKVIRTASVDKVPSLREGFWLGDGEYAMPPCATNTRKSETSRASAGRLLDGRSMPDWRSL